MITNTTFGFRYASLLYSLFSFDVVSLFVKTELAEDHPGSQGTGDVGHNIKCIVANIEPILN